MAGYAKQRATWLDFPATSTPILAANLNGLETAIYDLKYLTYNVKDYGAVGDGIADDTTKIQDAFNAASNGGIVLLPPGTYKTTTSLSMTAKTALVGAAGEASVISYTGTAHALLMGVNTLAGDDPWAGLRIANLRINGSASGLGGIKIRGATRWYIDDVRISGFTAGYGILLNGASFIGHIRGGRITNCAIGISAKKQAGDGADGAGSAFNAIEISGELEIQTCGYGIQIGDPVTTETLPVVGLGAEIHGITVEGSTSGGIWNVSGYALNVHDNFFEGNTGFNVRIGSVSGNTISPYGMKVEGNFMNIGTEALTCVDLLRATHARVDNNIIITTNATSKTAFNVAANSSFAMIRDNAIGGSGVATEFADAGLSTTYLENPRPFVSVTHSTTQTVGTAAWTSLTFDTDRSDAWDLHTAGNPTRLAVRSKGWYTASCNIGLDANATGIRGLRFFLNNTTELARITQVAVTGGNTTEMSLQMRPVFLSPADYLELQVFQDSGVNRTVAKQGYSPEFTLAKVEL